MRISDWSSDVCSSDLFPRRYAAAEYLRRASRRHEVQNGPQTDPNICAVRPELVEACPERLTSQSKGAAHSFSGVHIRTGLRQAQHERKQDMALGLSPEAASQNGRATGRERVGQYGKISGGAGTLK